MFSEMVNFHVSLTGRAACHFGYDDAVLFASTGFPDMAERMTFPTAQTSGRINMVDAATFTFFMIKGFISDVPAVVADSMKI